MVSAFGEPVTKYFEYHFCQSYRMTKKKKKNNQKTNISAKAEQ